MKGITGRLPATLVVAVILVTISCISWFSGVSQEKSTFRSGVSRVNITPPVAIPMSGYGGRQGAYQGIHDSLYAYAVVFDDGNLKAALITADLIGFSHQFCAETNRLIEEKTGIPAANIMLTATHNHGGPRNNAYGTEDNPDITNYVALLQQRIVEAAVIASGNLRPARIGAGKGKCNMNINRRAHFADGTIWLGRNPDGPCDKEVSVVRIDDVAGNPMAILTNWATHGTTGGQENYQITGDWPGATARFVMEKLGGNVVTPITAGASGDINPIYGPNDQFRDIDAIGMLLATEVVQVAQEIETYPGSPVSVNRVTIQAQGRKPTDNYQPHQALEPADPVEINLTALKVGNIVFAGISGELMTEIGMALKAKSPYSNTVVVTHCNGNAGYLITDQAYVEGGYEAMVSRTMPGTADAIVDNLNRLIRALR